MRQGKITLWLLAFCVLSGGVYFLLRENVKTTRERHETKSRVFEKLTADQIKRVEISGTDRQLELVRMGGRWVMQKPLNLRADEGEVEGLLHGVEFLEHKRRITPQEIVDSKNTLADYGLEKPRLVAKFTTDGGEHQIRVGHQTRHSEGVYVKIDQKEGVYLIGKSLVEKLDQPTEQWRNRFVFDLDGKISRVEIKSPKRIVELAKQNDAWRVVQPLNARASTHAVESLVGEIETLRAEKFLSEEGADFKKYQLEEPRYEITVKTDKSGEEGQTVLVGESLEGKQWSAVRKGQHSIVALGSRFVEWLDSDLKEFRDPQLLHVDKRDVQAFEVVQGDGVIRVERGGEGWKITDPKAAAADRELADQFLTRFTGLKIQDFTTDILTDMDKYGLTEKSPVVRLLGKPLEAGKEPAVLAAVRIGKRHPKRAIRFVKREDESSVYAVSEEELRFVPEGALDMRDRVFLSVPREAIREVKLKTSEQEVSARKNDRGDWVANGPVNQRVLDKIVGDASRLMAIRLVMEGEELPGPKFGFNRPMGTLTITEKNGDEKIDHEFVVGSKTEGKTFLYYKNKKLVAEIPVIVAEELTTPFLSPPDRPTPTENPG